MKVKLPVIKWVSPDVMYRQTIFNNTVFYVKAAKRVDLEFSSKEKSCNYVWGQMLLIRLPVVISLQYIQILNHYVVYLKLT